MGGAQWLRLQQRKLENNECLFLPNDNSGFTAKTHSSQPSSGRLKQLRMKDDALSAFPELLYLRKSALFVLHKSAETLQRTLRLALFLSSLEASQEDLVLFHSGQLGTEFLRIHSLAKQGDYEFSSKLEREQRRL